MVDAAKLSAAAASNAGLATALTHLLCYARSVEIAAVVDEGCAAAGVRAPGRRMVYFAGRDVGPNAGSNRDQHLGDAPMILEHAPLPVRPGMEGEFLAAFEQAQPIIAGMPGCRGVRLSRCVEEPSQFLLLVEWDSLEAHTEGFRGSAQYQEWKRLLHHFYDPFPEVLHFTDC